MVLLDEEVRIGLEKVDADSWEEVCRAVPADVAQTLKLSVERRGSVVITSCLITDSSLSSRAIGIGIETPASREQIDDIKNHFIELGLKNFALQISPHARVAGATTLEQCVTDAGLVVRAKGLKLLRGTAPFTPPESPFTVRKMTAGDKALFGDVCARGFGRPPIIGHWMGSTVGHPRWHHYLAYLDDQPAAAAAMYVDGKFVWFGFGATVEEFRNRGAQSALIAQRIVDALALGCEHMVVETEKVNASSQNLMRAGFELVYQRPNYGIPVPAA